MAIRQRDPLTGHETTGHEWAGITEINTRVPWLVWFLIAVSHIWALVYWVLMPAIPLVTNYTRGLLGYDPRGRAEADVVEAEAVRAPWTDRVEALPVADLRADPDLMPMVNQAAPALLGDNCAACHGQQAQGAWGFPSLVDGDWLWGTEPEAILETLRVGINSTHPEARYSQIQAFDRDGILSRPEVLAVVDHVRSLSGAADAAPDRRAAGAELFAANCATCHGEEGEGNQELGAPNLSDGVWLYGGRFEEVYDTVWNGRQGWMPQWEGRLSPVERKVLAAWLLDRGGDRAP